MGGIDHTSARGRADHRSREVGRRDSNLVVRELGAELDGLALDRAVREHVTASTTRDDSPTSCTLRMVACSSGAPTTTAA